MTRDELLVGLRGLSVDELIGLAPVLRTIADTAEKLGKDLSGPCFNVIMKDCGPNKTNAIKTLREMSLGLGLKEAKDLIESPTPAVILHELTAAQATKAKEELTKIGTIVELEVC